MAACLQTKNIAEAVDRKWAERHISTSVDPVKGNKLRRRYQAGRRLWKTSRRCDNTTAWQQ